LNYEGNVRLDVVKSSIDDQQQPLVHCETAFIFHCVTSFV